MIENIKAREQEFPVSEPACHRGVQLFPMILKSTCAAAAAHDLFSISYLALNVQVKMKEVVALASDKIRNQIEFKVWGKYALFSDPVTRMGGEKLSYPIPTYQALKGITESIYWRPSIIFFIDEVCVMNPIRMESKNIRPISYEQPQNTLSIYTYLADPLYLVRAHFIANPYRTEPDLIADGQNEHKHHNIARRMVQRGGRRDIFLGTRECQGYVEPCDFDEEKKKSYYAGRGEIDFGLMFHGFDYPDETGRDMLAVRFWRPKMAEGVVSFCTPQDCTIRQGVRPMKAKPFGGKYGNFTGLDQGILQQKGGGTFHGLDPETL